MTNVVDGGYREAQGKAPVETPAKYHVVFICGAKSNIQSYDTKQEAIDNVEYRVRAGADDAEFCIIYGHAAQPRVRVETIVTTTLEEF